MAVRYLRRRRAACADGRECRGRALQRTRDGTRPLAVDAGVCLAVDAGVFRAVDAGVFIAADACVHRHVRGHVCRHMYRHVHGHLCQVGWGDIVMAYICARWTWAIRTACRASSCRRVSDSRVVVMALYSYGPI